jgi:hypothetical protein
MENLILAALLYLAIVAAAYQPKTNCTTTEPINYFPDFESENSQPEPEPMAIAVPTETSEPATVETKTEPTEPKPMEVSDFKSTTKPTLSALIKEEFTKPLEDLTIRELYAAAANAKVKGYKRLNKAQLIAALAA